MPLRSGTSSQLRSFWKRGSWFNGSYPKAFGFSNRIGKPSFMAWLLSSFKVGRDGQLLIMLMMSSSARSPLFASAKTMQFCSSADWYRAPLPLQHGTHGTDVEVVTVQASPTSERDAGGGFDRAPCPTFTTSRYLSANNTAIKSRHRHKTT